MSSIYNTQDYFSIELTYDEEIVGTIANVKIKYKDPDDIEGSWNAVHDSINKTITYNSSPGQPIGKVGRWVVWSFITFNDGSVLPGTKFKFLVKQE